MPIEEVRDPIRSDRPGGARRSVLGRVVHIPIYEIFVIVCHLTYKDTCLRASKGMHRVSGRLDALVNGLEKHSLLGVHRLGLTPVDAKEVVVEGPIVLLAQVGVFHVGTLVQKSSCQTALFSPNIKLFRHRGIILV